MENVFLYFVVKDGFPYKRERPAVRWAFLEQLGGHVRDK